MFIYLLVIFNVIYFFQNLLVLINNMVIDVMWVAIN